MNPLEVNPLEEKFKKNQRNRNFRNLLIFISVIAVTSIIIMGLIMAWFSKRLEAQNVALRENNELIACLLAVHDPAKFPSANQQLCRNRIDGTNNSDGTFLSGAADGVFPTPSIQDTQKEAPNINPPRPSRVEEIINAAGGVVDGITKNIGI